MTDTSQAKRALAALARLQARVEALESQERVPCAVRGIGCRLPGGAQSAAEFWRFLVGGGDGVSVVPQGRWSANSTAPRRAGFVHDIDGFDAALFEISELEATTLDPQQRLLLEVTWQALEDAGIAPLSLRGSRTGVFIGAATGDYYDVVRDASLLSGAYAAAGSLRSFCAGRLAFHFGFEGPALVTDTACSSSLVALHLACQSLRNGECDLAVVGGANVLMSSDVMEMLAATAALSPDGKCSAFDSRANGFVRAEGAAAIVLQRASDVPQNTRVYGVVRGSAINHDGRSTGLTAPNVLAQQRLVELALKDAGVAASRVGYVEAHGTGTSLGDPIEFEALKAAFGNSDSNAAACFVGAVKTNVGHLEAAAGIVGVIKACLALQHGEIPANLNFRRLNPRITTEGTRFVFPTKAVAWPRGGDRRVAAVSAFGLSGTNAHVILEEGDVQPPSAAGETAASESASSVHTLTLSAASEGSLRQQSERYAAALESGELSLSGASYTSATLRAAGRERLSVTGPRAEVCEQLRRYGRGETVTRWVRRGRSVGHKLRVGYLFTGQGSQYDGMASALYRDSAVYRAAYDRCVASAPAEVASCLRAVASGEKFSELGSTQYTQPALYAVGYGLSELWSSYGLSPSVVLGHSVGEYVAATVAGLWSVETGMRLVCARGRLMQQLCESGAMVSVRCDPQLLQQVLSEHRQLDVASYNGAGQYVLSGSEVAVSAAREWLAGQGVKSRRLAVSHGFHSREMSSMQQAYQQEFSEVEFERSLSSEVISNVTGAVISAEQLGQAQYWVQHVREPVRFAQGVESLLGQKLDACVELGAQPTLSALAAEHCKSLGRGSELSFVYSLRAQEEPQRTLRDAAGALFVQGAQLNWQNIVAPDPALKVALPTYAFDRKSYRVTPAVRLQDAALQASQFRALGTRVSCAGHRALWERVLSDDTLGFIAEHRLHGTVVVPGTLLVELAQAACKELFPGVNSQVLDAALTRALTIAPERPRVVQVVVDECDAADELCLRVFSREAACEPNAPWMEHFVAQLNADAQVPELLGSPVSAQFVSLDVAHVYAQYKQAGLDLGESFRRLRTVECSGAWSRASVRASVPDSQGYVAHPAVLDAALQGFEARWITENPNEVCVPVRIDAVQVDLRTTRELQMRSRIERAGDGLLRGDLDLFDEAGRRVGWLRGLYVRVATAAALERLQHHDHEFMRVRRYRPAFAAECSQESRSCWVGLISAAPIPDTLPDVEATCEWEVLNEALAATSAAQRPSMVACVVDLNTANNALGGQHTLERVIAGLRTLVPDSSCELVCVLMGCHVDTQPWADAIGAVFRCVRREGAWHSVRTLQLDTRMNAAGLATLPEVLRYASQDQDLVCKADVRSAEQWDSASELNAPEPDVLAGNYVVTGGAGGLGLAVAKWLLQQSNSKLLLLGRRPLESIDDARVHEVVALGADYCQCDVSDEEALRRALSRFEQDHGPITDVIHAAGVVDDGLLHDQGVERVQRVLAPKISGALALHRWSVGRSLRSFVMFSSAAAVVGSAGQAVYAAGNGFLDGLVDLRRAQGLPATSINWGPWADVGMAARLTHAQRARLAGMGLNELSVDKALECLELALASSEPHWLIGAFDWREVFEGTRVAPERSASFAVAWREMGREQIERACFEIVQNALAHVLGARVASEVDPQVPLRDYGLDSLGGTELAKRVAAAAECQLPATALFEHPSVSELAAHVASLVQPPSDAVVSGDAFAAPLLADHSLPEAAALQLVDDLLRDLVG